MPFQPFQTTQANVDMVVLPAPSSGFRKITGIHIQTADTTKTTVTLKDGTTPIRYIRCATDADGLERYWGDRGFVTKNAIVISQSAAATLLVTLDYEDLP